MPADTALLPVASLWIGDRLRWIDRLALASFRHHGHEVTLYHAGDEPPEGAGGIPCRPAAEVTDVDMLLGKFAPAVVSDMFRYALMRQTPAIWVDTDALCLRPLHPDAQGYLAGYEDGGWINGAVLRLPPDSAALGLLLDGIDDAGFVPDWLPRTVADKVREKRPRFRLIEACRLSPNILGPRALTHVLRQTGEDAHALPQGALNPLPWYHTEVAFNPHGGVAGWLGPETRVLHLYASRLRNPHLRRRPPSGSFIADLATQIGFSE